MFPREILTDLAEVAIAAPVTGQEVDYTQTLRECFDARLRVDACADEHGRGGYVSEANVCEIALQYMASLPAWREVNVTFGGASP